MVGGNNVIDTTRKICAKLLSNNVAKNTNWTGRNTKNNFSKLENLLKCIVGK